MLDARNLVTLTGGLVADPETPSPNLVKLRLAVDFAGSEKDSDNNSGYFDVTYWLNSDTAGRNADFVKSQVTDGKMKKGSRIAIVGRLVQERWKDGEQNRSRIVVVAEQINYATTQLKADAPAGSNESTASIPSSF
jgi:single-stranded DNA-binding protein